jgi:hypothetical protein
MIHLKYVWEVVCGVHHVGVTNVGSRMFISRRCGNACSNELSVYPSLVWEVPTS